MSGPLHWPANFATVRAPPEIRTLVNMLTHGLLVAIIAIFIIGWLIRHLVTIVIAGIAIAVLLSITGAHTLTDLVPDPHQVAQQISSLIDQVSGNSIAAG